MSGAVAIESKEGCGTCYFSMVAIGQGGQMDFAQRICRRNPPVGFGTMTQQGQMSMRYMWPICGATDWCGEWKARPA